MEEEARVAIDDGVGWMDRYGDRGMDMDMDMMSLHERHDTLASEALNEQKLNK